jgi:hypothetical protein
MRRVITMADCHALAASKNAKCLSTEFDTTKTPMIWQCKNGHIVNSNYYAYSRTKNCAQCRNFTLETCQKEAQKHNGRCLATAYWCVTDPIDWECEVGHVFTRALRIVMGGEWCPKCDFERNLEMTRK